MTFQFDRNRQRRVLGVIEQFFCRALCQRRKAAQFIDQRIGCLFKLRIGYAVSCHAPIEGLAPRDTPRAHHDVLGTRNADHFLQPRRPA